MFAYYYHKTLTWLQQAFIGYPLVKYFDPSPLVKHSEPTASVRTSPKYFHF